MTLESTQKGRLEEARFRAIVRDRFGVDLSATDPSAVGHFAFGVSAVCDGRAFVVSSSPDPAVLGGVLLWVTRAAAARADVVFVRNAGMHARRLAMLAPEVTVWRLDGADVVAAPAAPLPPPVAAATGLERFEAMIERCGARVCHEAGILRAEVRGLEVGRVVDGDDGPVMESGVGRFDREAGVLLQAGRAPEQALAAVVARVAPHRVAGAAPHPIGRLGRARWLRSLVLDDPSLIGLDDAVAVDPITPRVSLLDDVAATVVGRRAGRRLLAIFAVGVDLGLVPEAADQVLRHEPDEVVFVLPRRDRVAAVVDLWERLPVPVRHVDIDVPWEMAKE